MFDKSYFATKALVAVDLDSESNASWTHEIRKKPVRAAF